jgi:hypothetical protein
VSSSVLQRFVTPAAVVSCSVLLRFVTPAAVVFSSVLLRFVTPAAVVFSSVLLRFVTPAADVSSSVLKRYFCFHCSHVSSPIWLEFACSLVFLLLLLHKCVSVPAGVSSILVLLQQLLLLLPLCPFLESCFEFVLRLLLCPALSCKELLFPTLCG